MRVRLSSFLDAPAIVYFCPRDASPECTAEAQGFRNLWLSLHEKVAMVFGVSSDDRVTHRDFATAERLPFLLVADDGGAIARAFGVPSGEGGPRRIAFLVGKDGAIARVFSEGAPEGRAESVLQALAAGSP